MLLNPCELENNCINREFREYLLNDPSYSISCDKLYFDANKTIIKETQTTDAIYIVVSGVVIETKNQVVLHFLGTEECLGLDTMFHNQIAASSIISLTKTTIYKIPTHEVIQKLKAQPEGILKLNKLLSNHTAVLKKRLTTRTSNYDKTLQALLHLAFLYGEEKNDAIYMTMYFSKKMLANYLQLSYATVASICKRLVAQGILHDEPHGMIIYTKNNTNL
ncbi:Crp/Fnr family transcriptional regulator [Listeria booriae]|uniref:Crp/Fnr family transcriptional regulator n=1 Tax=Listeria booriae TaxID=1552123 RepID=A0A842AVL8_9LIST|nr:Crp/Fnr family transcriptional regulator [Listeria booriae]MBC1795880.1 Crp/Fnr family transcriptional regulator [Listeria booriae]